MHLFTQMIETRNRYFWLLALLLFLGVSYGLFANTFTHGWVYDDQVVITENPDIKSLSNFVENQRPGRPVRELSLMLDYALFGMKPAGWHVQHLFWHALNGFLVFALVLRFGGGLFAALAAGLIFLVHPLQVEVVANLSHRKGNLALALMLLSWHAMMVAYGKRLKFFWTALAIVLAVLGALTYQVVYVMPLIWISYELLFLEKRQRVLTRFPGVLAAGSGLAIVSGLVWYLQANNRDYMLGKLTQMFSNFNFFAPVNESLWLWMMLKSWAFMFVKFVWPAGLAIDYIYKVPRGWLDPWVIGAIIALFVWAGCIGWFWKRSPLCSFSLLWVVIFWLPVANLYPTSAYFAADRYMYVPMVGLAILLALALSRIALYDKKIGGAVVVVVVTVLACLTIPQNQVWHDNYNLYEQSYRVNPTSSLALNNFGAKLMKAGQWQEGLALIEKAAENPYHAEANMNMALFYNNMGLKDKAAYYFKRARNPHGGTKLK